MAAQATAQKNGSPVTSVNRFPVVVITHDPEYRDALGEALAKSDYQARFPRSLAEARRQIVGQFAPVIAIDATLPTESWSQIMTDIRHSGGRPKIVVLRAGRSEERPCHTLGSDTYTVYDARRPEEVRTVVNEALQECLTEPIFPSAVDCQHQGGI